MRRGNLICWWLALTFTAALPAFASWGKPTDATCVLALTDDDAPTFDETLPRPPMTFRTRVRKLFGAKYEDRQFTAFSTLATWASGSDFQSDAVIVDYGGEPVGDVDMYYHPATRTLRVDLEVEEKFRRAGLYRYLVKLALDRFPDTQWMPSRMYYGYSTNVRVVVDAVFGGARGFQFFVPSKLTDEGRAKIRERILRGLEASPCLKTRAALGFGRLEQLELYPARGGLAFQVRRGKALPDWEVKVTVVVRGSRKEIRPDGRLVAAPPFLLPGYVDSHPW